MPRLDQLIVVSGATGLLIPVLFRTLWYFLERSTNLQLTLFLQKLMLILWPTSLMTLPASLNPAFDLQAFLIASIANGLLYTLVALTVWLGIRKHLAFLLVPTFCLGLAWWLLLTR